MRAHNIVPHLRHFFRFPFVTSPSGDALPPHRSSPFHVLSSPLVSLSLTDEFSFIVAPSDPVSLPVARLNNPPSSTTAKPNPHAILTIINY